MRKQCSECNSKINVCPKCGSDYFTWDDTFKKQSMSDFVQNADDGQSMVVEEVCWNCRYHQKKEVTVNFINEG